MSPISSISVINPRGILRDFGLELDESTTANVWDSSTEMRYIVLPKYPTETEGTTEEDLIWQVETP